MTSSAWRTAAVVTVAALSAPVAAFTAFVAAVVWSGCFLSCETPDRTSGALLWGLAAVLAASGPALGWRLRRGRGVAAASGGLALGLLLTGVVLV